MFDITSCFSQAKAFAAQAKGALILCISDTSTKQYPALSQLLKLIKPAAIIHTGDLADEFKVGRLEDHRQNYETWLQVLMDILTAADCPLYFISGNNDDLNLIIGSPQVTVLPGYTTLELEGVRFLLDHYPITDGGDVDFALSGHTGNFDLHYPPQDLSKKTIYINGMFHWALIDSETKDFLRIPCREPLQFEEWTDENDPSVHYRKTSSGTVRRVPSEAKWRLTQTHLHAGHENFASIRSHAAEAKKLGYDAIFITEHDTRMNRMQGCIEHFHLSAAGEALREDRKAGWYREEGVPAESIPHRGGFALRIPEGESAFFFSVGKKHQASLLADLTVSLVMDFPKDAAVLVDFTLSQRPDNLEQQHLIYGFNACSDNDWFLPVEWEENGVYFFPLSRDVLKFDPLFGQDNAFLTVHITAIRGEARVLELNTSRKYVAEEVRKRQKTIANTIGREYKIKVCSGFEVTFGHHHNCFSSHVPAIHYGETGYEKSDLVGAAYLRSKNATFAYNHMFQEYKKTPEEEHEQVIQKLIEIATENRFDGAQLLEVGFPHKKQGFTIEEHLRVWDALGMRGVRMIGYGDSDCHDSKLGWQEGNCFASWIFSESSTQECLERAMRAGKVCFGNPVKWKSKWEYSVGNADIGQTLLAKEAVAYFRLWELDQPVEVRIIRAGEILCRYETDQLELEAQLTVQRADLDCCPVRLEVWSQEGDPVFFTNPVYLIKS